MEASWSIYYIGHRVQIEVDGHNGKTTHKVLFFILLYHVTLKLVVDTMQVTQLMKFYPLKSLEKSLKI